MTFGQLSQHLDQNCTALDFAFSIHTFLGSHCIGAKVNHKLVPLSHKLQSGDQVEILTSKSQHVQPSWINFATTAKAKAKITSILKREQRAMQQKGEDMLHEFLTQEGVTLTDEYLQKLCLLHQMKTPEELYAAIGGKQIVLGETEKEELKEKQSSSNTWKKFHICMNFLQICLYMMEHSFVYPIAFHDALIRNCLFHPINLSVR